MFPCWIYFLSCFTTFHDSEEIVPLRYFPIFMSALSLICFVICFSSFCLLPCSFYNRLFYAQPFFSSIFFCILIYIVVVVFISCVFFFPKAFNVTDSLLYDTMFLRYSHAEFHYFLVQALLVEFSYWCVLFISLFPFCSNLLFFYRVCGWLLVAYDQFSILLSFVLLHF